MLSTSEKSYLADLAEVAKSFGRNQVSATIIRMRSIAGINLLAFLATSGEVEDAEVLEKKISSNTLSDLQIDHYWFPEFCRANLLVKLNSYASEILLLGMTYALEHSPETLDRQHVKLLIPIFINYQKYSEASRLVDKFGFLGKISREFELMKAFHEQNCNGIAPAQIEEDWRSKFLHMVEIPTTYYECLPLCSAEFSDLVNVSEGFLESNDFQDGPKITVIMTSYQPGDEIFTSVKSIILQTWQNWELLIIDDGSGKDYTDIYNRVSEMDSRIRLITLKKNQGTYHARNIGLLEATGKFITGQDSDDWSHPMRLSKQIKILLDYPEKVASLTHGIRTTPSLNIQTQYGQAVRCEVAVSLMIKRLPVVYRLGFYDEVRKAADSEYHLRLLNTFGSNAVAVLQENLYVIRYNLNSLSRGDFTPGWRHPHREYYRLAYTRWHERIKNGEGPFVERDGQRKFAAPIRYAKDNSKEYRFNTVIICDFKQQTELLQEALSTATQLSSKGIKIALAHADSLRHFSKDGSDLSTSTMDFLEKYNVPMVSFDDDLYANEVLIIDPESLLYNETIDSAWTVKKITLKATKSPIGSQIISEKIEEIVRRIWPRAEVSFC